MTIQPNIKRVVNEINALPRVKYSVTYDSNSVELEAEGESMKQAIAAFNILYNTYLEQTRKKDNGKNN